MYPSSPCSELLSCYGVCFIGSRVLLSPQVPSTEGLLRLCEKPLRELRQTPQIHKWTGSRLYLVSELSAGFWRWNPSAGDRGEEVRQNYLFTSSTLWTNVKTVIQCGDVTVSRFESQLSVARTQRAVILHIGTHTPPFVRSASSSVAQTRKTLNSLETLSVNVMSSSWPVCYNTCCRFTHVQTSRYGWWTWPPGADVLYDLDHLTLNRCTLVNQADACWTEAL